MQSHFVPILKAPSSTPKYNIVDRSSILRMLDDCSPQNIWYWDFCGELSFSVLYPGSILLQKITCNRRFFVNDEEFLKELSAGNLCAKISMLSKNSSSTSRLWIKTYFFYPYAAVVITIWLVPAIKASDEQLPSMEKQLLWKLQIKTILLEVFCKIVFWKIWQNSYRTPVPGYLFQLG